MVQHIKEALVNGTCMHLIFKSLHDPFRLGRTGRSSKKEDCRGRTCCLQSISSRCSSVSGSVRWEWLSHTDIVRWAARLRKKVENHCSVWPLSWAKAKQIHLSQQFPSTSFSQAPWWHQPCFCNYLTSVFQISNEPARVTNTHISSGKLSTHWTGCWPSGMN